MPRACPTCGRTWGPDAAFCGACGTHLDPSPDGPWDQDPAHAPNGSGPSRGLVLVAVLAVAVAAALAVPRVDLPSLGTDRVDDEVALPDDVDSPRPTPTASEGPVRCLGVASPTACIMWQVETRGPQPLGPRLPGTDVLVSSGPNGLQVREAATGELRWSRDDIPEVWPLGVVDDVIVARTRSLTQGFAVRDGAALWAKTGLRPVGAALRLEPPSVVLGRGDSDGTRTLVALDPGGGDVRWEWDPPWTGTIKSVASTSPDAVLATGAGRLARIDAATGQTVWTVDTVEGAYLQAHPPGHVTAQPLDQDDGTAPVLVHDTTTGEVVQQLSDGGVVMSHLVTAGVLVVHRPAEQTVDGLSLRTGQPVWSHPLRPRGSLGFPVDEPSRGPVVVMDDEARLVRRLDPTTGELLWEAELPTSPRGANSSAFLGQPMLVADHVVVEDPSSVVTVLDLATGRQRARVDGGLQLDVRSLDPLTLVRGNEWFRIDVRDATEAIQ